MDLSSLPTRPLDLSELRDLDDGERFHTVLPAAAFDLAESEHRLVPAVVFVTMTDAGPGRVVAAGFDLEDGWTRVTSEDAAADEQELEAQARTANRTLRDWAQKTQQRWAEPDGASALLEAFESG